MRRRRKWVRRIGTAGATVAIGAMLGFLIPTIVDEYTPEPELAAVAAESPVARQFIAAFLADDQTTLTSMGIPADVKLRASRFRAEYARVDAPVHLGSTIGGGYSLHSYAARVVRQNGEEDLISWRVATTGGQAILVLPPSPIEAS